MSNDRNDTRLFTQKGDVSTAKYIAKKFRKFSKECIEYQIPAYA